MNRLLEAELRNIEYYISFSFLHTTQLQVVSPQLEPINGEKVDFNFPSYKMGFRSNHDMFEYLNRQEKNNVVVTGTFGEDNVLCALLVPKTDLELYKPIPTQKFLDKFPKQDFNQIKY